MDGAHSFKILLLILSCPAALHVFKPLSIFKTSGIDTLIVVTRTHNDEWQDDSVNETETNVQKQLDIVKIYRD